MSSLSHKKLHHKDRIKRQLPLSETSVNAFAMQIVIQIDNYRVSSRRLLARLITMQNEHRLRGPITTATASNDCRGVPADLREVNDYCLSDVHFVSKKRATNLIPRRPVFKLWSDLTQPWSFVKDFNQSCGSEAAATNVSLTSISSCTARVGGATRANTGTRTPSDPREMFHRQRGVKCICGNTNSRVRSEISHSSFGNRLGCF